MTKPESELTEKQKQMKIRLTPYYPTELSDKDKKMIKEKYQGRSSANHTDQPDVKLRRKPLISTALGLHIRKKVPNRKMYSSCSHFNTC